MKVQLLYVWGVLCYRSLARLNASESCISRAFNQTNTLETRATFTATVVAILALYAKLCIIATYAFQHINTTNETAIYMRALK